MRDCPLDALETADDDITPAEAIEKAAADANEVITVYNDAVG